MCATNPEYSGKYWNYVSVEYDSPGACIMQLIPLEKIHSSSDSVRKARESHLIDKAMTLEPHGLNRRDELL